MNDLDFLSADSPLAAIRSRSDLSPTELFLLSEIDFLMDNGTALAWRRIADQALADRDAALDELETLRRDFAAVLSSAPADMRARFYKDAD